MDSMSRRRFLQAALVASGGSLLPARELWAELPPGVETRAAPLVTADERQNQPNLWVMEVNFKPLRMIRVDMPSKTGNETKSTLIWYLCYRAVNRPIERRQAAETEAIEVKDRNQDSSLFIPEFTLVTDDNSGQKRYIDRVMPLAQAAINKRERREYKNSVEIVGPVPAVVPVGETAKNELFGVATWRGIDPETDRFKIYMSGFSNGYEEKTDPDGKTLVLRKSLMQEFWRPGDEFDESEAEIRRVGMPQWIYR